LFTENSPLREVEAAASSDVDENEEIAWKKETDAIFDNDSQGLFLFFGRAGRCLKTREISQINSDE
jgi:hypothetical protein